MTDLFKLRESGGAFIDREHPPQRIFLTALTLPVSLEAPCIPAARTPRGCETFVISLVLVPALEEPRSYQNTCEYLCSQ